MSTQITFGFGVGIDKDGQVLNDDPATDEALKRICRQAAELFGGYTLHRRGIIGGWVDPRGKLVEETAVSLVCLTGSPEVNRPKIQFLVALIKRLLNQEAVAVIQQEVQFEIV